jgi:hypothetical protein
MMRFADIFGKGLAGAITGIDLTDMVNQGGLAGAATGINLTDMAQQGGLAGKYLGIGGNDKKDAGIFDTTPALPSTQGLFSHGFGDYDGDGFYKVDLPGGGPMTEAEKRKIASGVYQLL